MASHKGSVCCQAAKSWKNFRYIFTVLILMCFAESIAQNPEDSTLAAASKTFAWGSVDPGKGFTVAKTKLGTLNVSAYVLARYINQLPKEQSFTDYVGRIRPIDTRQDIQLHRILLHFMGYIYDPKLDYNVTVWTVNATNQVAIIATLGYKFHKAFNLYTGVTGMPGIRSLLGSHPYWLGTDRTMAEEFFRPGFTSGVWAAGELFPKFEYKFMIGNNLSLLGISAVELTRSLAPSASIWWMPTTGEFGPRGAFGDYEMHEKLATRIGTSYTHSRENRFSDLANRSPDNTQVRHSDGLLFFETGTLAPGVTVIDADYNLWAADAGIKYKGIFLQTEYYWRTLSRFNADGPLPVSSTFDHGFMIQFAFPVLAKKLEMYMATSQIFNSFRHSYEYLGGLNYYPFKTRNFRVNTHVIHMYRSPAGGVFGYYTAGQKGITLSLSTSVFF
jgi:hypothetical protein